MSKTQSKPAVKTGETRILNDKVYLSISFRVKANVEALNAVESLGNIIRHRKATVIASKNGRLEILTVPAISGEALRHGIQAWIADLAQNRGLPVCALCKSHEFVKQGVGELTSKINPDLHRILTDEKNTNIVAKEFEVIRNCIVEDIGGFLIPFSRPMPIKRTSKIQVGYMIPALSDRKFGIDIQFHVRNAPMSQAILQSTSKESRGERREEAQSIYYVESSSAVYTFTINVELGGIGKTSNCIVESGGKIEFACKALDDLERLRRIETVIDAIAEFVKTGRFGGKQSSYLPDWRVLSSVALITTPIPTTVYSGHRHDYVSKTLELAKGNKGLLGEGYRYYIAAFVDKDEEDGGVVNDIEKVQNEVSVFTGIADYFRDLKEKAMKFLTGVQ